MLKMRVELSKLHELGTIVGIRIHCVVADALDTSAVDVYYSLV